MTVVTRFAPSPTGFLHIGGARTALFNWLFARHHCGKFRLRIEDTDQDRSTPEAVEAIIEGLRWLELDWDGQPIFQSKQREIHITVAEKLLADGRAYYCYASPTELDEMRTQARAEGRPIRYDGRWRNRDPGDAPSDILPVIRFKAPLNGDTVISDMVQGTVSIPNSQLDDMILVRSDGTPTYMLASVVDDHEMNISHVVRGTDHLTNAARQANLYTALNWDPPDFAHIPLIHGSDGSRLSKRHGALGISTYRDMGYLPASVRNYLARLGWSHGDDEIFNTEQAILWFDLSQVGRSSARFDLAKLSATNSHYIRTSENDYLITLIIPILKKRLNRNIEDEDHRSLSQILPDLKLRSNSLLELADNALFYLFEGLPKMSPKAEKLLDNSSLTLLERVTIHIEKLETWNVELLESSVRTFATNEGIKLGQIAQPMRAAITGQTISPPIFSVMSVIGRKTTINRLKAAYSRG